jgi:purine-nucleoside phosphorylase
MSTIETYIEKINHAHAVITNRLGSRSPKIAIVLGSGLGAFAERLSDVVAIPYSEIPGFPVSSIVGHAGELILAKQGSTDVLLMKGRCHYYEGYSMQEVTLPMRAFQKLGIKKLILTNAAGGINSNYEPGDLVLIKDHINLHGENPLRGPHHPSFGERFPDMSEVYNQKLREVARRAAKLLGIELKSGVYAISLGPSYETPAEVRMLQELGADLVGMSTVPEAIVARQAGMQTLGISCVTNMAAGISPHPLSHEEVTETSRRVAENFSQLMMKIIENLDNV